MLVCAVVLAIVVGTLTHSPVIVASSSSPPQAAPALLRLHAQIANLTKKHSYLQLPFNRLADLAFQNQPPQLEASEVDIVPSIGIPYKDNFYYTLMVKHNRNYYSLKGDLIYAGIQNGTFFVSARNQFTYFAELGGRQLAFNRCRVVNRKAIVEPESVLELKAQMKVDKVFIAHYSSLKQYIVVDNRGKIAIFDRNNNTIKEIITDHPIIQTEKINNNLLVLTQTQLMFLNLNKNASKVYCVLPYGSIDYFKFQDYNIKYFFGIKEGRMYQFQLGNQCKIVKTFHIPLDSRVEIANQLAFILAKERHYALNLTTGQLKPYRLPAKKCLGEQKLRVIRKIQASYIISRICVLEGKVSISLMSIDLQEQENNAADFSKFRIPLLLLSFGVIVYMSVKNKKHIPATSQQEMRNQLFQQYPQLREIAIKEKLNQDKSGAPEKVRAAAPPVEKISSNSNNSKSKIN